MPKERKSLSHKKKRNTMKKMIQKSMDKHKRKRNNNKKMTQNSMQMWTSVLKRVKIQKPMKMHLKSP
ncbi:unnamed protein product [Brassica oleracea]